MRMWRIAFGSHDESSGSLTSVSTTILLKAVQFAAGKHQAHRRKDVAASPYINHPDLPYP
jgi:hypothetical protein